MILQPPPLPAFQIHTKDEEHLKVISICHFVMAGLYLLGIGFVILHFILMSFVLRMVEGGANKITTATAPVIVEITPTAEPGTTPETIEISPPVVTPTPVIIPPVTFPKEIMPFFKVMYLIMGGILVTLCVCNALSGHYIRKRKNQIFSYIIAGINCIQFPLGTALGVFTFIVLSRESVKIAYSVNRQV